MLAVTGYFGCIGGVATVLTTVLLAVWGAALASRMRAETFSIISHSYFSSPSYEAIHSPLGQRFLKKIAQYPSRRFDK